MRERKAGDASGMDDQWRCRIGMFAGFAWDSARDLGRRSPCGLVIPAPEVAGGGRDGMQSAQERSAEERKQERPDRRAQAGRTPARKHAHGGVSRRQSYPDSERAGTHESFLDG